MKNPTIEHDLSPASVLKASAELIELALKEDLGAGDITSQACIPLDLQGRAVLLAREPLCVCGQLFARDVFTRVDPQLDYESLIDDGQMVEADSFVGRVHGPMRSILSAERTALNFLQRLSGIATVTNAVVTKLGDAELQVLDTRKTTPGWRALEKYAVRVGGGSNHRMGLFDAFLIKNNHIDASAGDVGATIRACRAFRPEVKLEVEVRSIDELRKALVERPDMILLDNMAPEQLREAVAIVRADAQGGDILLEASGGITPETLSEFAACGVDAVSMGALTHSVRAVDISLRWESGTR